MILRDRKLTLKTFALIGLMVSTGGMSIKSQISSGGKPLRSELMTGDLEWVNLEELRVDELLLEDEWLALTGKKSQRIAEETQVSIRPDQAGEWTLHRDGTRVWKLGIRGRGAKGLGLVFSRYVLEPGCRLFICNPSGSKVFGAFTSRNNQPSASLPVSYLPGDELIIQLEVPPGTADFGELQIGSVRQAYKPVFDQKSANDIYYGSSGECNIDINCALGDDWQVVKHSVVRLLNTEKCSGVLVNNAREDGKAYIYTGAHCVFKNNKFQPPVFYFNYESPTCDGPDGSVAQTISKSTLISTGDTLENPRDADSLDFALLELLESPPESYKPYFAGWNRSLSPAQHTTTIHHPSGDVKKISLDNDPPQISMHDPDYLDDEGLKPYSYWRILEWDEGTTEGGSSGSPLFNENQLVIGTLTAGLATCSYLKDDYYTRLDLAWDYYPEPAKQLKHWLDPDNTGVMSLAGKPGWNVGISPEIGTGGVEISLYPNPAADDLWIDSDLPTGRETEILVYQITGKLLLQKNMVWEGQAHINLSEFSRGIYLLRIRQETRTVSQRFVINR
jgi:hypothetical protein